MNRRSTRLPIVVALLAAAALAVLGLRVALSTSAAAPPPVYVHMNGANDFLEPVVVVRPGQRVVFVNQDTDMHTVIGYEPSTGRDPVAIDGKVAGTPGPGHQVGTYAVSFQKPGVYAYYCSVHARLVETFGNAVQAVPRKGVDGYGGAMAGTIIVTNDPHLLSENPATTTREVLPNFFGG